MSILQMSISAGLLVFVILLLRAAVLYRLPKILFLMLWSVVLLRLLVPFSIPVPFTFYSMINEAWDQITVDVNMPALKDILSVNNDRAGAGHTVSTDSATADSATAYTVHAGITDIKAYAGHMTETNMADTGLPDRAYLKTAWQNQPSYVQSKYSVQWEELTDKLWLNVRPNYGNDTFKRKAADTDAEKRILVSLLNLSLTTAVWLVGMICFFLFFIIVYMKNYRTLRDSLPVCGNDFLDDWHIGKKMMRPLAILQSDRIKSPLAIGIVKPRIILPKSIPMDDKPLLKYVLRAASACQIF